MVQRTGGVPLFVEELTRALLETGDAKITGREIPVTLHDSLMARLDRLVPAKEVAQVGSVIGSEFSYELLHAVHPMAEEDLQGALRSLADAELIYVHGIPPEANYTFKHALIRDAAYEALLRSRRKDLHRLVARTIDEKFIALKDAQPEVLARHWTEAGEINPAIEEWCRAGKAAEARNAFSEALASYQQALALLDLLPGSPERDLRELELRQWVVRMLWVTKGYSAPETIEATERAAALAEKSRNLAQLVDLMVSKGVTALNRGDITAACALADPALDFALRDGTPTSLGMARALQMYTRFESGDLAGVEEHFIAGLKFFDDPGYRRHPGATTGAFGTAAVNAWHLGRADVARERMARMIAAADGNTLFEQAYSGQWAATILVWLREYEQAGVSAERALKLSMKHQFPLVTALARCLLGRARAELGRAAEGVELIRQGIAGMQEVGSFIGFFFFHLAVALERDGLIVDALESVEQSFRIYKPFPDSLRLRGELRLKQGQMELAESDFREAIALAQKSGAKALELRATMSLARLLDVQRRCDEARAMLADIYNEFTEGFDTADLKDAKALLDQMNS